MCIFVMVLACFFRYVFIKLRLVPILFLAWVCRSAFSNPHSSSLSFFLVFFFFFLFHSMWVPVNAGSAGAGGSGSGARLRSTCVDPPFLVSDFIPNTVLISARDGS